MESLFYRRTRTREISGDIRISWAVAFLLISGTILRVAAGIYYTRLEPFHFESVHVAMALATRGEYADAYGAGTGATAHLGPFVPLIMAGFYYVFGPGQPLAVAMMIVLSALAVSASIFVFYRIFEKLGVDLYPRLFALAFVSLAPIQLQMESAELPFWEAGYATLALALIIYWILELDEAVSVGLYPLLGLGAAVALLEILNPAAGLSAAGALGLLLLRRTGWAYRFLVPVATLGFFLLATTPWQIRNEEVLGAPIRLRTSMGYSLAISYHDGAAETSSPRETNVARFDEIHPHSLKGLGLRKLKEAGGEVRYSRKLGEEAKRWIEAHPGEAATIAARNLKNFYFPPAWFWDRWSDAPIRTMSVIRSGIMCTISIVAFGTLLFLLSIGRTRFLYLLIVAAAASAPYVVAFPLLRYRYPISTMLMFLAVTGVAIALRKGSFIRRVLSPG